MTATTSVVDASVVVKWVLKERGRPAALRLLEDYRSAHAHLLAPPLVVAEVGNALWKHVQRGSLDRDRAATAFRFVLGNLPILEESETVSEVALQLAVAHGCTYCDCLYLALAMAWRCDLITADEKFFLAVHRAFPMIQLLAHV